MVVTQEACVFTKPLFTYSPWDWDTFMEGFYNRVYSTLTATHSSHSPLPEFALERLVCASVNRERWLVHPSVSHILRNTLSDTQSLISLLYWVTANTPEADWYYRPSQAVRVVDEDGSIVIHADACKPIRLCHRQVSSALSSVLGTLVEVDAGGFWLPGSFPKPAADDEILYVISEWNIIATQFPLWADWIRSVVRVAYVRPAERGRTLSGSMECTPGFIWLSTPVDRVDTLETAIHESAHCHLLMEEYNDTLVRPGAEHVTVYSPLRKTLRPLRGAFFAAHALVHMHAFLREVEVRFHSKDFSARVNELSNDTCQVLSELQACEYHLTPRAQSLLVHMLRIRQSAI
jgi:hypothetical protein